MSAYQGRGLHGQVVEEIGSRIVGGGYQPGAPMLSEDLEREYEVSKTVVREALKVLSAKGLVESRQKRGTVVRPRSAWSLLDADVLRWQGAQAPDSRFLDDLAEVRAIIEPAAARLAALRRTDDDVLRMTEALDLMESSREDSDLVVAADVTFHRAVLDAANNELLGRMEVVLISGLQIRDQLVHRANHSLAALPMHRVLLGAITDGAAELAASTMNDLLTQASIDVAGARQKVTRPG